MGNEAMVLLAIWGIIYNLPPGDREKVEECARRLRELVAEYGNYGQVALTLVGAEAAAAE